MFVKDIMTKSVSTISPIATLRDAAEIMTGEVKYLFDDETIEDLIRNMSDLQIRRLPVISREKRLVGIVSLGDLAAKSDGIDANAALRSISRPASAEAPVAG